VADGAADLGWGGYATIGSARGREFRARRVITLEISSMPLFVTYVLPRKELMAENIGVSH
jgi:hypothetical protein